MNLIALTKMLFSLCYRLLINIWTFLARVFVLLLGFTDGFGLLSLCISVFNDCMYFTFDYYIHLITYAFRFYRWLLLLFLNINAQYKCFSLHKLGKYKKHLFVICF